MMLNTALTIWMSTEKKVELLEIILDGGKVRSYSKCTGNVGPWQKRIVNQLKRQGWELFDEEHNYDSHELIFVKLNLDRLPDK
jgi:hypothetical protein